MPSIPQSLLWISLVVLWLFVLVPMLVSKRDAVRRTSDVALATRVLTSGASARLLKRGGPAAGHRSDPQWQHDNDYDEYADDDLDGADDLDNIDTVDGVASRPDSRESSRVFVAAAAVFVATEQHVGQQGELDYLDVDVVTEESGELPLVETERTAPMNAQTEAQTPQAATPDIAERAVEETDADVAAERSDYDDADQDAYEAAQDEASQYEYEYVEDSSGLEPEAEPVPGARRASSRARRPATDTAVAVGARKYEFRKRVLMVLAAIAVISALVAFTATPVAWWICGGAAGATMLYLGYLRRQTRIEQQVRARRARRAERPRAQRSNSHTDAFEVVPSRLRRPGMAVLEIDDEDPVFEHLEYASAGHRNHWRRDLARAAGQ